MAKKFPAKVIICAKHQIDDHAQSGVTHILSIENPDRLKETPFWFKGVHKQIRFNDTDFEDGPDVVAPDADQIREILEFGREVASLSTGEPRAILIHCQAGVSRSPAAAYAIIAQYLGAGHARDALEEIRKLRPVAIPNRLVVKLADEILEFRGELLEALQTK